MRHRSLGLVPALLTFVAALPAQAAPIWFWDDDAHTTTFVTLPTGMHGAACFIDGNGREDIYWWGNNTNPRAWFGQANKTFTSTTLQTFVSGTVTTGLAGDFDADGDCDLMLYREFGLSEIIAWRDGNSWITELVDAPDGRRPFVYESGGLAHIFWYGPGATGDEIWHPEPRNGAVGSTFEVEPWAVTGDYIPFVGDFDGDFEQDIFWHGPGPDKPDFLWWKDGFGDSPTDFTSVTYAVFNSYVPVAGNFGFDLFDDEILWYRPGSATDFLWVFQGDRSAVSSDEVAGGNFVPFAGDFDGNGDDDIVWGN
ncbi:MAG: VCBS repeat-containing protein [Nannocystaceae bacterium]